MGSSMPVASWPGGTITGVSGRAPGERGGEGERVCVRERVCVCVCASTGGAPRIAAARTRVERRAA
jgi:hypothetical protein